MYTVGSVLSTCKIISYRSLEDLKTENLNLCFHYNIFDSVSILLYLFPKKSLVFKEILL